MKTIPWYLCYLDDDRVVSHDAPCFMSYYHCVRDISWSVFFSTRLVNVTVLDLLWFPNMFPFSSFCFREYRVGLCSLCLKGEFQRYFEALHWSVENYLCTRSQLTNTKYETRQLIRFTRRTETKTDVKKWLQQKMALHITHQSINQSIIYFNTLRQRAKKSCSKYEHMALKCDKRYEISAIFSSAQ